MALGFVVSRRTAIRKRRMLRCTSTDGRSGCATALEQYRTAPWCLYQEHWSREVAGSRTHRLTCVEVLVFCRACSYELVESFAALRVPHPSPWAKRGGRIGEADHPALRERIPSVLHPCCATIGHPRYPFRVGSASDPGAPGLHPALAPGARIAPTSSIGRLSTSRSVGLAGPLGCWEQGVRSHRRLTGGFGELGCVSSR